jgi:uncharacterized Fe-S cluster-containing radical SAM superfamily protein
MIFVGDIETDVVEHCNLKCSQCSHSSPYFKSTDSIYSVEQFDLDINLLSKHMHSIVFRFVGGEPLLNNELEKWIDIAKFYKISDKISLFTNGLLLDKVDLNILDKVDDLRISVYNLDKEKFNKILSNIKLVNEHRTQKKLPISIGNHIRTFLKFNLTTKNEDVQLVNQIFNKCYHKNNSYSVFNGRIYRCFAARKKYKFLDYHKNIVVGDYSNMKSSEIDSFNLSNINDTELVEFINNKKPLESCKWCLGCSGPRINNHQLIANELEELTPEEVDFEQGEKYVAYCLHSWYINEFSDRNDEIKCDEFYFNPDEEEFKKFHSSKIDFNNVL